MKYPRIPHVSGSHGTKDDLFRNPVINHKHWIITEKLDGSQISFQMDNGIIRAFNRNTELLLGHSDRQFSLLQQWVNDHYDILEGVLIFNYILFGEWLQHKHTVFYNKLPDRFIGFGLYDRNNKDFYPFNQFEYLDLKGIHTVPKLFEGIIVNFDPYDYITTSHFGEEEMEGIVLHTSDDSVRYKYVTKKFQDSMDNSSHWRKMERTMNKLA